MREGAVERTERYRSGFDAVDDAIWVDPVSDYEQAHPHVPPHGVNFFIAAWEVGKPEAPVDFIGVPILAPAYSFEMAPFVPANPAAGRDSAQLVAAIRRTFHDPYPLGRTPPPALHSAEPRLPEIEHLVVTNRVYAISLAGEESVNGHFCYHLVLRPLRDPDRYRLRQLWIDEASGATWRLQEALNFVSGPGTTVPWTVDFTNLGGAQYIAQESADESMRYRGLEYTGVTVAFENLRAVPVPQGDPLYIPPNRDTLTEPQ